MSLPKFKPYAVSGGVDFLDRSVAHEPGETAFEFGDAGGKFNDLTHRQSGLIRPPAHLIRTPINSSSSKATGLACEILQRANADGARRVQMDPQHVGRHVAIRGVAASSISLRSIVSNWREIRIGAHDAKKIGPRRAVGNRRPVGRRLDQIARENDLSGGKAHTFLHRCATPRQAAETRAARASSRHATSRCARASARP